MLHRKFIHQTHCLQNTFYAWLMTPRETTHCSSDSNIFVRSDQKLLLLLNLLLVFQLNYETKHRKEKQTEIEKSSHSWFLFPVEDDQHWKSSLTAQLTIIIIYIFIFFMVLFFSVIIIVINQDKIIYNRTVNK